eukprot:5952865-Lingulodinium_polyedra.AAC.1
MQSPEGRAAKDQPRSIPGLHRASAGVDDWAALVRRAAGQEGRLLPLPPLAAPSGSSMSPRVRRRRRD